MLTLCYPCVLANHQLKTRTNWQCEYDSLCHICKFGQTIGITYQCAVECKAGWAPPQPPPGSHGSRFYLSCNENGIDAGLPTIGGNLPDCVECDNDHYKSAAGNGCCNECPVGRSTDTEGATSVDDCKQLGLAHFFGSQLVTNATWGDSLNEWAGQGAERKWALCFSSFTDDATSPAEFHAQCDQYNTTVTVARNSLGYTFGGYVRRFLSVPSLFLLSFSPLPHR